MKKDRWKDVETGGKNERERERRRFFNTKKR